jgi:hypothetical protein
MKDKGWPWLGRRGVKADDAMHGVHRRSTRPIFANISPVAVYGFVFVGN